MIIIDFTCDKYVLYMETNIDKYISSSSKRPIYGFIFICLIVIFVCKYILIGGFSIEILKPKWYHIICCYHNFTKWNYYKVHFSKDRSSETMVAGKIADFDP